MNDETFEEHYEISPELSTVNPPMTGSIETDYHCGCVTGWRFLKKKKTLNSFSCKYHQNFTDNAELN